jgi:hypothetical protein
MSVSRSAQPGSSHPERGGDGLRHQSGVDQRRQLDQPDAFGVVGQHGLSEG